MRIQQSHRFSHRGRCLILAAALCLTPSFLHSSSNPAKMVAQYSVSSMGFNIGEVTTTQHMAEDGGVPSLHFETRSAVKASFLWLGYHLDTIEKGTILKGNLGSYSRKGRENGAVIDIEGRLEDSAFRFDVRDHGASRSIVIPRSSYDYTTMECPEARLDFSNKTEVTLRMLDVEKMAVVRREYRFIRNAHYTVAGKEHPCRIVDFSDKNKKARRWINWDGAAVVMYRQDGTGDKNSYSVKATSLVKEL